MQGKGDFNQGPSKAHGEGVAETDFKEVTVMQLSCGGVGGGKGEIRKRPRGENVQAHNQKEGIFLVQGS